MKFVHVADLHIGKQFHGKSLLDTGDQRDWIRKFIAFVQEERPQAVLISGDVYDRVNPPREAIEAVDGLLTKLAGLDFRPAVMMIAGNHDSGSLVGYLKGIAALQNIYVAGAAGTKIEKVTLTDEHGPVDFWLVPFVFPAMINYLFGTEFRSYDEALKFYLEQQNIDFTGRNVILSHQNITRNGEDVERGGSETMVGGVGGIDYHVFDDFEYAALGHIHAAQPVGRAAVRYAGSPLCYHFDELKHPDKGPVVVTLFEKGKDPEITAKKIEPLHPLREFTGTLAEIEAAQAQNTQNNEYIKVNLMPEADGSQTADGNTRDRLSALFKEKGSELMSFEPVPGKPKTADGQPASAASVKERSLEELFTEFWNMRLTTEMDDDLREIMKIVAGQSEIDNRRIGSDPDNLNRQETEDIDAIVKCAKRKAGDGQ